jgi:hypothetical protein
MITSTKSTITKAKFERLSPKKQRVLLAKDVLAQLASEKYIQSRGNYVNFPGVYGLQNTDSGQKVLERTQQCEVCAKGALICSYVKNFNTMQLNDMINGNRNPVLQKIFGIRLWHSIEALFEGWCFDKVHGTRYDSVEDAEEEGVEVYNASKTRYSIESLMKNIIRNDGALNYNGVVIE